MIVFGGPLTLGELAAAEQVKPPTMTRLVSALEDAGLVRRESDREGRARGAHARDRQGPNSCCTPAARVASKRLAAPIAELTVAERKTLADAADILASVVARLS